MKVFKVAMSTAKEMLWEANHNLLLRSGGLLSCLYLVCPFAN